MHPLKDNDTQEAETRETDPDAHVAKKPQVDGLARRERIALLAYLKAEGRGFAGEGRLDDWLAAEREVDGVGDAGAGDAGAGTVSRSDR